jgi:hypothetical protein
VDRNVTTRFFDRFRLQRHFGTLEYQKIFSERTELDIKAFGGFLQRYSKRQRGGDFGVAPDPNPAPGSAASTNDIQTRNDYIEGAELRLRHDYDLAHDTSTFTGGLYFYHALQDRFDERGATPDADSGLLRRLNTGETTGGALFAENGSILPALNRSRDAPGVLRAEPGRDRERYPGSGRSAPHAVGLFVRAAV